MKPQRSQGAQRYFFFATFATFALILPQAPEPSRLAQQAITIDQPSELTAVVSARCSECAWDVPGREAVTLRIVLDGKYSQHLTLVRTGEADYEIALGNVAAGRHEVRVDVDRDTTATQLRGQDIVSAGITIKSTVGSAPNYLPLALAPIVYARPNTVGKFTDPPVYMWYESERTERGVRYRYSVIFTNEDGGTQTDRLMATWGRTTDIEYIYSVEVNRDGSVMAEDFQGPDHKVLPFGGRREGRHPLLWVATDNNMVTDRGDTTIRYMPLPVPFDLTNQSREMVMDRNPWLYAVASKEMMREGKIRKDAAPGTNAIPDPRRFVYLEACADVGTAAVALAVRVGESWFSSDRGLASHRIVRDDCFRGAVPLPEGIDAREVNAVRVAAFERPARNGQPPVKASAVRLSRINTVFALSPDYVPLRSMLQWSGLETIPPGQHFDLPVAKPRPLR